MLAFLVLLWGLIAKVVDLRRDLFRQQEHERFLYEAKKELEERLENQIRQHHWVCERIWILEDAYGYVCREYGVRPELQRQFLVAADVRRRRNELHGLQDEQGDRTPAVPVRSDPNGCGEGGRHAKP